MSALQLLASLGSQWVATGLAAVSAFASVIALAMPAAPESRLRARMRAVAEERDRLRASRIVALSPHGAKGRRLRLRPRGMNARLLTFWPDGAPDAGSGLVAHLAMAGLRGPMPAALFQLCRAAFPVLACVGALLIGLAADMSLMRGLTLAAGFAGLGYGLPGLVLARLIAHRQRAILRAFPDSLDLLLICVHAGMSVEAALARVTGEIAGQSPALAEELGLTMAELSYLPSRWQAYHNLGERAGLAPVKLIAAALAQAERYGTPISQALTAAARECRETRLFEAERRAAALPPKLTMPLVVFFLPVLMCVILAPAVMKSMAIWKERPAAIVKRGLPDATPPHTEHSSPSPPRAEAR
jgi:tight adherence protein C